MELQRRFSEESKRKVADVCGFHRPQQKHARRIASLYPKLISWLIQ